MTGGSLGKELGNLPEVVWMSRAAAAALAASKGVLPFAMSPISFMSFFWSSISSMRSLTTPVASSCASARLAKAVRAAIATKRATYRLRLVRTEALVEIIDPPSQ
jgi:hypothetical protein